MILRIDKLAIELPAPKHPSPNSASAVQELLGGKFGEMSTLMNYTFQSFNFRGRDKMKPFYDLIANIAAEEYGHIELVAATINTMLTGASPTKARYSAPMCRSIPGRRPLSQARPACDRQAGRPPTTSGPASRSRIASSTTTSGA